jgi:iron complex outermembrane recepter protein
MNSAVVPARGSAYALLAAALLIPLHAQVPASPSTAAEEPVHLPQFSVSAEKADPYRPTDSVSASRIRGRLIDTPLTINVATQELIRDLGANSIFEATRYFSGVSPGRGTGPDGIGDRQNFRGFESLTKTIDNFSSVSIPGNGGFVAVLDPVFIERAEVVMGPNTILAPTGAPGGSINLITKSPRYERANELSVSLGNYYADKITFDSTGPVGSSSRWAYRAIAAWQHAKTYIPGGIRNWVASAQLAYKVSPTADLTLKWIGEEWQFTGSVSNIANRGWQIVDPASIRGATIGKEPTPGSGFTYAGGNGAATWNHTYDRVNIGEAVFTAPLSEHVSMRLAGQSIFDNNVGDSAFPSATPANTYDPATGQVIAVGTINPSALPIVARWNHAQNQGQQVQNDYAGKFSFAGISLQPVAGWALHHNTATSVQRQFNNLPPANLFAGVYDPPKPNLISDYILAVKNKSNARQFQTYAFARAGFLQDRLLVTGGASRTWVRSNLYNYNVTTLALNSLVTLDESKDTYLAGAMFKVRDDAALYYSFTTNAALVTGPGNVPLWQSGRQHELGVKLDFFAQRLSFTTAHFQISQSNLTTPNPLFNVNPVGQPATILTDQTNRGYEFNLVGGLTRNLTIIASYTKMELRDAFDRRPRNAPDRTANLLLNYRFTAEPLKNLNVFAAATHNGKVAGETASGFTALGVPQQPGYYLPEWTVINAGAGYQWNRWRFNLNLDNVLNAKFPWQPSSRLSVSPYPGFTYRLTTTVRF